MFVVEQAFLGHTDFSRARLGKIFQRIGSPFFNIFAKCLNIDPNEERMLARRGVALAKLRKEISCSISTTEAVLRSYATFTGQELAYVPVFVDPTKLIERQGADSCGGNVFFSGRMTNHRSRIITELRTKLLELCPILAMHYQPKDEELERVINLTVERAGSLDSSGLDQLTELFINGKIFDVFKRITQASDKNLYEMYIPQDKRWPYSSPNRTLLSLGNGYIPIDYGQFSDHDINKLTIKVETGEELLEVLSSEPKQMIQIILDKVYEYNEQQYLKLAPIKKTLLEVFHNRGQSV